MSTRVTPYSPDAAAGWWRLYPVEPWYWTQQVEGGYVARLIYPGGAALIYILVAAISPDASVQMAVIRGVHAAAAIITYLYIFHRVKTDDAYIIAATAAVAGLGEPLAAPLAVVAASYAWRGERAEGVFWGLAASMNQLYALAALPLLARGRVKAFLHMIAAFLAVNAPFIAWGPSEWLSAMMYSALQPVTPVGIFLGRLAWIGAAQPAAAIYMIAVGIAAALYAALLARKTWMTYLSPIIFLVFYPRALFGYIPAFVVPAMVAGAVRGEDTRPAGRLATLLPAGAVVAVFTALTLLAPPHLTFEVKSMRLLVEGGNITGVSLLIDARLPQNVTIDLVPLSAVRVYGADIYTPLWWTTCGTFHIAPGPNNITCIFPAHPPAVGRWGIIVFNGGGYTLKIAK